MTMVRTLRSQSNLARVAALVIVAIAVVVGFADDVQAEPPPVHYHHAGKLPPGAIGSAQLSRGGPLPGYFQPVEIRAPEGAVISLATSGEFAAPENSPIVAGMLIGSVYRLRVSNIPQQEGLEVFPTIEVIDRLYPPVGQEFRFPIPIEVTQEEVELALSGHFVTRVVYLEEPGAALPVAERPDEQSYFEVADGDNPLDVADGLGRPMAILRLGGRVPGPYGLDDAFMFGSPSFLKWKPSNAQVPRRVGDTMAAKPDKVELQSELGPIGRSNPKASVRR